MFLEECKYVIKEKKNSIKNIVTDDIEFSSSDSDESLEEFWLAWKVQGSIFGNVRKAFFW